ncbi:MAG TPA: HGxxPAAW family protein [Kineosporiaceae bacterium]|jgi:hypothetical protein|nr:HGxxPAAW family protein [Kineosporiaceae bacterium]
MAERQQVQGRGGVQQGAQQGHVEEDHDTHGQSTAAWVAVGTVLVASLIMSIAVVITTPWLFWVGAVLAVAGGISGKVLSMFGFGASGRPGR